MGDVPARARLPGSVQPRSADGRGSSGRQAAMTLAEKSDALTAHRAFGRLRELKDPFRRAALSASINIAGGLDRGTTAERLALLYIARGSAGEVRSMPLSSHKLRAGGQLPVGESHIVRVDSPISELAALAESCSRQIRAWTDHLQNSDIRGQRHLNDKTCHALQAAKSADGFFQKLQALRGAALAPPSSPRGAP